MECLQAADLDAVNPHFREGVEYQENCQRCVPTYELRRRGYDVDAMPAATSPGTEDLCYAPYSAWCDPDVRATSGTGMEDIDAQMKEWGDGARAQVVVKWKGVDYGHTFVAERMDGQTRFYDPQDPSQDARFYFMDQDGTPLVEAGNTTFCRIDTLKPSSSIFSACHSRR
ncbi:toxin glutamine deamidase domain-containing protein [Collinsella intestinalis]|uniref:toxin glutamine deamidase domain-containing protein n=1 Tax=Collinsella intestinalis TaxID=147207 RepID=UPI003D15FA0C